jgi:hypothetical protein
MNNNNNINNSSKPNDANYSDSRRSSQPQVGQSANMNLTSLLFGGLPSFFPGMDSNDSLHSTSSDADRRQTVSDIINQALAMLEEVETRGGNRENTEGDDPSTKRRSDEPSRQ